MPHEHCSSCGKPLGNSADGRCHSCGGRTYRAGEPYDTGAGWKVELGLMGALRELLSGGEES